MIHYTILLQWPHSWDSCTLETLAHWGKGHCNNSWRQYWTLSTSIIARGLQTRASGAWNPPEATL